MGHKSTPHRAHDREYWGRLRREFIETLRKRQDQPTFSEHKAWLRVQRFRYAVDHYEAIALEALTRHSVIEQARIRYIAEEKMKKNRKIKEHWTNVARLGCIITGQPAEIAHCHGGSISRELDPKFRPGIAQRQNHWLVIPLNRELHRGQYGLDTSSVTDWEAAYGDQTALLEEVSHRLGYCVFEAAGVEGYVYRAFHPPAA